MSQVAPGALVEIHLGKGWVQVITAHAAVLSNNPEQHREGSQQKAAGQPKGRITTQVLQGLVRDSFRLKAT